jgi:gliding motility-associated-like protein
MKTAINHNTFKNFIVVLIVCSGFFASAQVLDAFEPRLNETVKGDVCMIANNVLSRTATTDYNGVDGNHDFTNNVFVDIDNDDTTFNSSSANLINPEPQLACLSMYKVYIYWAAADREPTNDVTSENQPNWNYNDVKLMLPGETTYTTITADEVVYRGRDRTTHIDNDPYVCFKDITNEVQNLGNPYGKYQVANVEAKLGSLTGHDFSNIGTSGGWQILFVYESPKLPSKNISLYDGYAQVTGVNNNFDILFDGFQTISLGLVDADIIIGSLEGDSDLSGDMLQIQNVLGDFVDISTPQRLSTNFFNSKITDRGGINFINRNPASLNTLGFDAGIFNLNNPLNTIIANDQSSATFRLTSNQETYGLYLLGLSIEVWAPDLAPIDLILTTGSSPAPAGSTLGFSFDLYNRGNDNALNVEFSAIMPPQVTNAVAINLPTGITSNFNTTTREFKFEVEDGMLDVGDNAIELEFELVLQDECYFLETDCDLDFELQFIATYSGFENTNMQNTLSSASIQDCNQGDLLPLDIEIIQPEVTWATVPNALDRIIECSGTDIIDAINAAQNLEPVTDKCNFNITKTSGTFISEPDCPNNGTYTNTWNFTDECGTTIETYTQNIIIQDTTAPILNVPADTSVECTESTDTAETGNATANDSCGNATITYTDSFVGDCGNTGVITRTWEAKDNCGNTSTDTQTITIIDTTPPTITLPGDVTLECGEDTSPSNNGVATATDTCGNVTVNYTDTSVAICGNTKTITRTWTATDDCGNTTSDTQTIATEDNAAPTFTTPENITLECDADLADISLTGDVTDETDNCSTNLEATFIDTITNGDCANESIISRTWSLTDECDNTTTLVQTITIQDTTAPTFTLPANVTLECDDDLTDMSLTGDVTDETDNCSNNLEATFIDTITNGDCTNESIISRTWSLTDECDNTATLVQTITIQDTIAPTFTVPADVTLECDADLFDVSLTGDVTDETDNCSTNLEATFIDTVANGDCDNESIITRTWSLTDECDNTTTLIQTINIQDTTAPTFTVPANVTFECDVDLTDVSLTGDVTDEADNCSTNLEATFVDTITTSDCANESIITRTWSLTDECDNTTTLIQTITVQDTTAPTFTVPADVTLECDANLTDMSLTGDVTDEADNCSTNLDATFVDMITNGDCANESIITRTWSLTDECDNTTTLVQTINIQDTTAPTFTVPSDVTLECDAQLTDVSFTGDVTDEADNCSTDLDATFVDTIANGGCANESIITRTWSLTDECDNTTTIVQTISIQDTTAPTFTVPANVTLECDADLTDVLLTGDVTDEADNCSTNLEASFVDTITNGDCANTYMITRIWSLTDECDNTATLIQTISIQDTTAPTFTVPADVTLECDTDLTDVSLTGDVTDETDNCTTDLEATFVDSVTFGDCANESIITRTWSLTDECDNTATLVQTITLQDTTAPTFTVPADITLECNADLTDVSLTGDVTDEADNCSTDLEATFVDTTEEGSCANELVITRVWTVTDDCENATALVQTITIQDTTAPTFTVPESISVECDQDATDIMLTGDVTDEADNCSTGLEATFTDTIIDGDCPNNSTITRTWTLTDDCENTTTLTQTISIVDTTAPTLVGELEEEINVVCSDIPAVPELVFEDACSTNISVEFNETSTNDGTVTDYVIIRDWFVSDECGNESVFTQTINVNLGSEITTDDEDLCIGDDFDFDLFNLLIGDYDPDGVWNVTNGDTTIDGSFFNPSSLLDTNGDYTDDQLTDYEFTYTYGGFCPGEVTVIVTLNDECLVLPCGEDDLIISKAVTANFDGINEFFTITGTEDCGFVYELQIFNRWGAKIYENFNYQNDWNGTASKASVGNSNFVPTGTYYYVLNIKNSGLRPITGPIYVSTK